ncbi:MAG: SsgA family sporulation/cell division regulator [Frankia sp.]
MTTRHDSITAEFSLRLVVPGGTPVPVTASVRYDPADPYAVSIGFRTGADEVVEWTFARQLLSDGVRRPTGEGDVQVWPAAQSGGRVVCLSLSSPSGHALFEMPRPDVLAFLRRTYATVALGGEGDAIDLDAELALLLWSGPEI